MRDRLAWLIITLAIMLDPLLATPAAAHEIRPAVVTITLDAGKRYDVAIALNIEALLAGIGPEHKDTNDAPEAQTYKALRDLDPVALKTKFTVFAERWLAGIRLEHDGVRATPVVSAIEIPAIGDPAIARISTVRLTGAVPSGAKTLRWAYAAEFGSNVARLKRDGLEPVELGWLKDGQASEAVTLAGGAAQSSVRKVLNYIAVGFTHIVPKGLDHILFVLGLYFLSPSLRSLLWQVTAFTLAHSLTLALGLYGLVSVPASIVEPLIALSIVYVAVENMMTSKLHVWRPVIVFAFGLLHGLGFAGLLTEIGLPRDDYVMGLIGFNIGVELGQLAVIAAAFAVTGLWFRQKPWYRQRIIVPASALIALAGVFWTVERIWFT
jgi:HupE / UreJ protein